MAVKRFLAAFERVLQVAHVSLLQNSPKQLLEILFEVFEDGVTLQ
jgi:hypothetical protein